MQQKEELHRREVSLRFLQNFLEFASHTPATTARVLYAKFRKTRSMKLRKILITKLFSEFAVSFEVLAALCLALQRRKSEDFLQTLSTYRSDDVRSFYKDCDPGAGGFDLVTFAALPALEEVRQRTDNPQILWAYEYSCPALSRRVRDATNLLVGTGFVTTHIYNKVKHGSIFVDDPSIFRDYYSYGDEWGIEHEDCFVYVPPFTRGEATGRQMVLPPTVLNATEAFAHKLLHNTHQLCKSSKEIAALATILSDLGLLW